MLIISLQKYKKNLILANKINILLKKARFSCVFKKKAVPLQADCGMLAREAIQPPHQGTQPANGVQCSKTNQIHY